MNKRDLMADLAWIENIRDKLWDSRYAVKKKLEHLMIEESFEGWPHAIERAIKAETLVRELVEAMNGLLCEYEDLILRLPCSTPGGQPIHYDSQAAKQAENLLAKAKEVLGDE